MDKKRLSLLAAAAGGLLLLWLLWPSPRQQVQVIRAPEFPPQLAEAIRDGVAAAREAREDAASNARWTDRWRLLALVIGVSVPLIVAWLIFRTATHAVPDEIEVTARLIEESRALPGARVAGKRSLLSDEPGVLAEAASAEESGSAGPQKGGDDGDDPQG